MEDVTFSSKLDWRDYRYIFLKNFLKTPLFIVLYLICFYNILSVLVELLFDSNFSNYGDSNLYFTLALFILGIITPPLVYMIKTKRTFDINKHLEIEYSIGLESISWKSKVHKVKMFYDGFLRIENHKLTFVLYSNKFDFMVINKKNFKNTDDVKTVQTILSKQSKFIDKQ